MKRFLTTYEWAVMVFGLGIGTMAFAQTKPAGDETPSASASASEGSSASKGDNEQEQLKRHIALLTKLHEKVGAKLNLSGEQKQSIQKLFQDHFKELRTTKKAKQTAEGEEAKDPELDELRTKMKKAKDSGDKQAYGELRKEMRDLRESRRTGMRGQTTAFLKNVESKLDEPQRKSFREIVRDLGLDFETDTSGTSIQELLKTVMLDEVGLSDDQKQAVRDRLKDVILSMDQDTKDSGDLNEVAAQFRADVRKDLSPAQWERVEEILKAEKESKAKAEKSAETKDNSRGKPKGEKPADE